MVLWPTLTWKRRVFVVEPSTFTTWFNFNRGRFLVRSVDQCDQIGRYLNVIGNKFSFKSSPHFLHFLGLSEKHCFWSKNSLASFGQLLEKNWVTFYSKIWSHSWLVSSTTTTTLAFSISRYFTAKDLDPILAGN